MSTETKNKVISSVVTAVSMTLLLIVLYCFGLYSQVPPPEAKQYVLIEFEEDGGGGGGGAEMPRSARHTVLEAPDLATQEAEDAPAIVRNPNSANSQNIDAEATKPNQYPGAAYRPGKGGGSGGGTGTGTGTGAGMGLGSGDGAGAGSGRGIGYGAGSRAYVDIPDQTINENGVIYVEVHVSANGKVLDARIISTSQYPTNITNAQIQQECLTRARSAKYVNGKEELRIIVFK